MIGETDILAKVRFALLVARAVISKVSIDRKIDDAPGSSDDASDLTGTITVKGMLSRPAVRSWIQGQIEALPNDIIIAFIEVSSLLSQILVASRENDPALDPLKLLADDEEAIRIVTALAHVEGRGEYNSVEALLVEELNRRSHALRIPFSRTVTTLLGPDALTWLSAASQQGTGKLQLHEFSRVNWHRIWEIENQLAVERELIELSESAERQAKAVVALSWTLAALASLVPDALFLGEYASHILSQREIDGKYIYNIGKGKASYVLISFGKPQVTSLIDLLQVAVINPLVSAADLMWIAAAMVQERQVTVRFVKPERVALSAFELFLSHRGVDAKRQLVENVRGQPEASGVFLDCMTMPHGVINRDFIFGSLARSKKIIIVETENYDGSEWCRKERWFAEALADLNLVKIVRCKLGGVLKVLTRTGNLSQQYRLETGNKYPISHRVLFDVDHWARKPNLHSLREAGHSADALLPIQASLGPSSKDMAAAVRQTFLNVLAGSPDGTPFDLWAAALQFAVAAFGISAHARSKDEVRRNIDQLVAVARTFLEIELNRSPTFRENGPAYLSLMAAAATIQLGGFVRELPMAHTISEAVAGAAVLHDGILLLDARPAGEKRDFRLRLAVEMIKANIGGVGIVQDATDEVHRSFVGDLPVEVLPCVTLHHGMSDMFSGI